MEGDLPDLRNGTVARRGEEGAIEGTTKAMEEVATGKVTQEGVGEDSLRMVGFDEESRAQTRGLRNYS
jgi:hypothetical protein|tara:strand:- start:4901 stop:5104 length:204 start_codon:yes stop_codon:yes gene_type:complete